MEEGVEIVEKADVYEFDEGDKEETEAKQLKEVWKICI